MNTIRIVVLIFLLLPVLSFAQTKGDNALAITNDTVTITSLGKFLMSKGFRIKTIDNDLGILYTDYKSVPGALYSYRADFSKSGKNIIGKVFIKVNIGHDDPASWRGGNKGPNKVTFYHLYKTLNQYSNTKTVRL